LVIVIKALNEHHTYFYEENRHGWGLGGVNKRGQSWTLVVGEKRHKAPRKGKVSKVFWLAMVLFGTFGDFLGTQWGFLGRGCAGC
jgi:hypothetical protein